MSRIAAPQLGNDGECLHGGTTMNKSFSPRKNEMCLAIRGTAPNNVFMIRYGEAMRERARELGLSDAEVARRAGISPRRYSNYVNEERQPDFDTLLAICEALKISPNQILNFRGTEADWAFADTSTSRAIRPTTELPSITGPDQFAGRTVPIQELDVRAGAGGTFATGSELVAQNGELLERVPAVNEWRLPPEVFRSVTASPPDAIKMITIVGNSMEPLFSPGQKVAVDTRDKVPSPPGVFALWDGLSIVVKVVEYIPFSEPPRVKITSKNHDYSPYERTLEEAYVQGRVIGRWQLT